MGIFEHFPYTNFHDLNLDRILERTAASEAAAKAAAADVAAAAADMAAANAAAIAAQNAASSATNTANNAANVANQAITAATALDLEEDVIFFELTWDAGAGYYTGISLEGVPQVTNLYRRLSQGRAIVAAHLTDSGSLIKYYRAVPSLISEGTSPNFIHTWAFVVEDIVMTTLGGITTYNTNAKYICTFKINENNVINNITINVLDQ